MAKNEPNKPDEVKTAPANETPAEEQAAPVNVPLGAGSEAPAPEQTADNAAGGYGSRREGGQHNMGADMERLRGRNKRLAQRA